jgi:hypothetical protein
VRYWYISTNTDTFGAAQGGVPVVGGELGLVQCLSAVHPRPLSICNAGRDPRCPPPAASKLVVLLPCNIQITSSEVLEHFRCPIKYVKDAVLAPELAAYENLRLCIDSWAGHEVTPKMWCDTLHFLHEHIHEDD